MGIFAVSYFFVTALAVLGFLVLIKKDIKLAAYLFFLIVFCLFWRELKTVKSNRYYSSTLFITIHVAVFFILYLSRFNNRKIDFAIFVISCVLLFGQMVKTYSGFRDRYVLDMKECFFTLYTRAKEQNVKSNFLIHEREFERITCYCKTDGSVVTLQQDLTYSDLAHEILNHGFYSSRNTFFVKEPYRKLHENSVRLEDNNELSFLKTAQFVTNSGHNKMISVYSFAPYMPVPDIDINEYYPHAELKAYFPEYEAFVYYKDNTLIWLIAGSLDNDIEIIYNVYSKDQHGESDKLTLANHGFFPNSKFQQPNIGKYRVYIKTLPSDHSFSHIGVGFNSGSGKIKRTFKID